MVSDILALSFDGLSSPSIHLKLQGGNLQGSHTQGWGFGWYPNDNQAAIVAKDPVARNTQVLAEALTDWANFRSTVFLCKAKGAAKGYTHHETQPFARSFAGRDWLFMHKGDLDKQQLDELHSNKSRFLEPLGTTDSELAFCYLLSQMQATSARKLSEVDPQLLLSWFESLDRLGGADMVITDGMTMACFYGSRSPYHLYYMRQQPPTPQSAYDSESATFEMRDPRDSCRTSLIFTSCIFDHGEWFQMQPGQLILARRGKIIWNNKPTDVPLMVSVQPSLPFATAQDAYQGAEEVARFAHPTFKKNGLPFALQPRLFNVTHITEYDYEEAVEHSTHTFRLEPMGDAIQQLISSQISISIHGERVDFEDVFGNKALHYSINEPYRQLRLESRSRVRLLPPLFDDHSLSKRQTTIPLVWMPWQRQMMMAYLLPPELPETQLLELTDYAMSFVLRNDYHLLATLEDINQTIYQDYHYVQGVTSLQTTPFEIYSSREGVCQDFANLFICLARLLNVPARYRMGYIYTGKSYENKIQSDASHAWVEVYLPYVGWRGFDPTNGCTTAQDHIRVACGRNYLDATPTSGTIFKGGGKETLKVEVKVEELYNEF